MNKKVFINIVSGDIFDLHDGVNTYNDDHLFIGRYESSAKLRSRYSNHRWQIFKVTDKGTIRITEIPLTPPQVYNLEQYIVKRVTQKLLGIK